MTIKLGNTYSLGRVYRPKYLDEKDHRWHLLAPLTDFYYSEGERFFLSDCFKYYES